MVEIIASPDCGNAPKKQVLRDYSIALAARDTDEILSAVADDVEWEIVGGRTIRGKDEFAAALDSVLDRQAVRLSVDSIITHGNQGAVSSTVDLSDNRRQRCCDVYAFGGHSRTATIKRITSYWIEVGP